MKIPPQYRKGVRILAEQAQKWETTLKFAHDPRLEKVRAAAAGRRTQQKGPVVLPLEEHFPDILNYCPWLRELGFVHIEAGSRRRDVQELFLALGKPSYEEGLAYATERRANIGVLDYKLPREGQPSENCKALIVRETEEPRLVTTEEWDRFSLSMALLRHDIRSPLRNAVGLIEDVAEKDWRKKTDRREALVELTLLERRLGALADVVKRYPSSGMSFSGIARVRRWREVFMRAISDTLFLSGAVSANFRLADLTTKETSLAEDYRWILGYVDTIVSEMLATRSFITGHVLEHGQKISIAELKKEFEIRTVKDKAVFIWEETGMTSQEGIYASLVYLRPVIQNLIGNAMEHGTRVGDKYQIKVTVIKDEDTVRLQVRNSGAIKPEFLENNTSGVQRLFLRGVSEKTGQDPDLVGLGGVRIRLTAEFMQGSVRAWNEEGWAVVELTLKYAA